MNDDNPSWSLVEVCDKLFRREVHVVPTDDLRPHKYSSTCWCKPVDDTECLEMYTHNALDRRDLYEEGVLLYN